MCLLPFHHRQLEKLIFKESSKIAEIVLHAEESKIKSVFMQHAADFGIKGNWNKGMVTKFEGFLTNHMNGLNPIKGTYRGTQQVLHYFNPKTGVNLMTDLKGNLISGWRLGPDQIKNLLLLLLLD